MKSPAIDPLDARLLLQHVLGISAEEYLRSSPVRLNASQEEMYEGLMARRQAGEPVAKIIGQKPFWKHHFLTNRHTLDPRPESEHIIEAALAHRPDIMAPHRILDCGTGTGCLLLSLLHEYPNATGIGIDILPEALMTAKETAGRLGLEERADFRHLPWTDLHEPVYDIVVSNPPYIPTLDIASLMSDVACYDPYAALDGGEDGLDAYRELFAHMPRLLKPSGIFICEIGVEQEAGVVALGMSASMSYHGTWKDLAGIPRVLLWEYE